MFVEFTLFAAVAAIVIAALGHVRLLQALTGMVSPHRRAPATTDALRRIDAQGLPARRHGARLALAGIATVAALAPSSGHAQTRILIDGSTGTAPLVAALGKAFAAKHGIAVEIGNGLGTKARFEALADGKIDIAMASHGLKVDDVKRKGMSVFPIAKTAVVFAVHESAKVGNLAQAQLCAIYEGKHKNWKELGAPDLAIVAHTRPDSEVDTEVVRAGVACLNAMKFPDAVKVMAKGGDMAKALAATPGAFGMTSATVVEQSEGKLKALTLDGVAANEANVAAGRYRLTRDAFLVIRNNASPAVKAFIDFVNSADGAAVIRGNGAMVAK
jgi:phosphate transport system substrate-binding protein